MHFLKFLPLLLLLVSCQDDDNPGQLIGPFCLETEDFSDCLLLSELPANEHFDLLVGKWVNVDNRRGMMAMTEQRPCGFQDSRDTRITLLADSTYVQTIDGDQIVTGRWFVKTETSSSGDVLTFPRTEEDEFLPLPAQFCSDSLGFSDDRATDGFLSIYLKE